MKLETLEVNALYENLLNPWDPLLFFDAHRMGSGNVAYGIGCSHSTVPAAHPGPRGYVFETLFPAVFDRVRRDFKVETFTHALWMEDEWPPKTWHYDGTIWAVDAKFAVNAYGLRNRMSILCETPGAASFERQVFAQYAWISSLLEYTNAHGEEMMEVAQAADEETVQRVLDGAESGELRNWVDGEYQSWGPIEILAYRDAFPSARTEYLPGTSVRDHVLPTGPPEVVSGVEDMTKAGWDQGCLGPQGLPLPRRDGVPGRTSSRTQNIEVEVLEEAMTAEGEEFVVDRMHKVNRGGYEMTVLDGGFFEFFGSGVSRRGPTSWTWPSPWPMPPSTSWSPKRETGWWPGGSWTRSFGRWGPRSTRWSTPSSSSGGRCRGGSPEPKNPGPGWGELHPASLDRPVCLQSL